MANYNVGNIEIGIVSNSSEGLKGIDKTIEKLKKFKEIDKNLQQVFLRVNQLANAFVKIKDIKLGDFRGQLQGITEATKNMVNGLNSLKVDSTFLDMTTSLNKVTNAFRQLNNMKDFDFKKMYESFSQLNRIIAPFLKQIKESEGALYSFSIILHDLKTKTIQNATKEFKTLNKTLDDTDKKTQKTSFDKMFSLGKLYVFFNYTRKLTRALASTVTMAMDFNETVNKFQVAMGDNYSQALTFVNKLTYAFNLSTESIMNYQATFKNMLSSLGTLSEDASYELSETLTRMSLDYASLFNVQVGTAMSQFQQVLAGQIRSIRQTAGYDVSENTIFGIYKELGGTKTMRQLDQMEKRLLRIIAIQRQMSASGAVGDFEKTINSASNQTKQLAETLKEVGLWLGQLTMSFMQPFIEKVLAGAIALREMLKALNIAKGFEMPEFGKGGSFDNLKDKSEEVVESMSAPVEETLESFDKLDDKVVDLENTLVESGLTPGEIMEELNKRTQNATKDTENLTKKEEELKRVMLGFDKLNILGENKQSEQTPDYQKLLDEVAKYSSMLENVKSKATTIAEGVLEWLGYTKEVDSKTGEVNWKLEEGDTNLKRIIDTLKVVGVVIASLALGKLLNTVTTGLTGTIGSLKTILTTLNPMAILITALVAGFVGMYTTNEEFRDSVDATIGEIKANLSQLFTQLKPFFDFLMRQLNIVIEFMTNLGGLLGQLILDNAKLISAFFTFDVDKIKDAFTDMFETLKQIFNTYMKYVRDSFKNLIDSMFGAGTFDKIMTWFSDTWENIKTFFTNLPTWFNDHVWKPIGNFFIVIINGIINGVETAINFIVKGINTMTGALSNLWTWMKIPAIPQIPQVNWGGIPMLANGGVIEQPTMAMVGEYAGAKSNPEIVTPQNIMRQTFMECMLPIAQAIISGDTKVVNAIEELANRPIELNGRKVSESIFNNLQDVAIRKGYTF